MMLPDALNIHGFTVVRLECTGRNLCQIPEASSSSHHYLYLKEHAVKRHHASKPQKRTLFICNVPSYLNETALKYVFEATNCGHVQKVFLHTKPDIGSGDDDSNQFTALFPNPDECNYTTKVAYVVFRSPEGVQNALSLPLENPLIADADLLENSACKTGVAKWCLEYRELTVELDLSALEADIESYVTQYDKRKREEANTDKAEQMQDDDGWVKVSKKRGAKFTEAEQQHQLKKEKKRKEEQELMHFYRFQLRESRREKIAELRKRFEEDKQRIALLRQQRKFKPF